MFYTTLETPIGIIAVLYTKDAITHALFIEDTTNIDLYLREIYHGELLYKDTFPFQLVKDSKYDISSLTTFEQDVLIKTSEIQTGETRSYQWVAESIGKPHASRAVGNALAKNPIPYFIPCHRVVRADGKIGNYVWGGKIKKSLLEIERSSE